MNFKELLLWSFNYCLNRRLEPQEGSNTTTLLYSLTFDKDNPTLFPFLSLRAYRTEIDHITDVVNGIHHNLEKPLGNAQLADEMIDMIYHLIVLSISIGVTEYEDINWLGHLEKGFNSSKENESNFAECLQVLKKDYGILIKDWHNKEITNTVIKKWIICQLKNIGGLCESLKMDLKDLAKDLQGRKEESESDIKKVAHDRHKYIHNGFFFLLNTVINDSSGSYEQLLRILKENNIDIWASISKTLVPRESAISFILCAMKDNKKEQMENIIERGVKELGAEIVIYYFISDLCPFHIDDEQDYRNIVATAIQKFESKIQDSSYLENFSQNSGWENEKETLDGFEKKILLLKLSLNNLRSEDSQQAIKLVEDLQKNYHNSGKSIADISSYKSNIEKTTDFIKKSGDNALALKRIKDLFDWLI
jgi:hypothetical protein